MSDKDAAEKRTITLAEAKAGLRLSRRQVVLVISDAQGTRRAAEDVAATPAGTKTISGTFRAGDHVIEGATFRLRKDSGDGPLLTPENLGGKTDLSWAGDHWVAGADGKYRFSDLPAGKYFVELFGKPEADA